MSDIEQERRPYDAAVTAREHFDWSMARAVETLEAVAHYPDDTQRAIYAVSSLQSDLDKHSGTASLLGGELKGLMSMRAAVAGTPGVREALDMVGRVADAILGRAGSAASGGAES